MDYKILNNEYYLQNNINKYEFSRWRVGNNAINHRFKIKDGFMYVINKETKEVIEIEPFSYEANIVRNTCKQYEPDRININELSVGDFVYYKPLNKIMKIDLVGNDDLITIRPIESQELTTVELDDLRGVRITNNTFHLLHDDLHTPEAEHVFPTNVFPMKSIMKLYLRDLTYHTPLNYFMKEFFNFEVAYIHQIQHLIRIIGRCHSI